VRRPVAERAAEARVPESVVRAFDAVEDDADLMGRQEKADELFASGHLTESEHRSWKRQIGIAFAEQRLRREY
jgi:hypothetical protein